MKRMIRANNATRFNEELFAISDGSDSGDLIEYRVYYLEDGEEVDSVYSSDSFQDSKSYARKYSQEHQVDTHIVPCPVDEYDQETLDYFEYSLGLEPYEVMWQSYED